MISTEDKVYLKLKYSIVETSVDDYLNLWLLNIGHSIPEEFFTMHNYTSIFGVSDILIQIDYNYIPNLADFFTNLHQYDLNRR